MSDMQSFWVLALLFMLCISLFGVVAELKTRLAAIEKRNEKQVDMLIALLQKAGIDPVTLN